MHRPFAMSRPRLKCILMFALVCCYCFVAAQGCKRGGDGAARPGATSQSQPAVGESQPLIQVAPARIDFGNVSVGTKPTAAVKLTNTSDRPLTIVRNRTNCGCMLTSLPNNTVIGPHQAIDAEVWLTAGRLQVHLNRTLVFELDDGSTSPVLTLEGDITAIVKTEPSSFDRASNPEGRIRLTATDGKPFAITSMTPPGILTEFPTDERAVVELQIPWDKFDAAVHRDAKGQWHGQFLSFNLTHPQCPLVLVLVNPVKAEGPASAASMP